MILGLSLYIMAETMVRPEKTVQRSVTLSFENVERVKERVGKRGFSSYLDNAVARQLERDAIADLQTRMEQKFGQPDLDRVAAMRAELGW